MEIPQTLGIIAGNGAYPRLVAQTARAAGVRTIAAAAFRNETGQDLAAHVDHIEWLRVGQLGRLLSFFRDRGVHHAMMAGQIAPGNLFDLRPDWKALLILARLRARNAETIFAAIADELQKNEIELLPATTFLADHVAPAGLIAGPNLSRRQKDDVEFGWTIARDIARLDIGQTVVVRNGTVLAVEGFDGTNATIQRGGKLAGKKAVVVKVAKANQDMRFDVPVIGIQTVRIAAAANISVIAVEAGRTLLLEKEALIESANRSGMTLFGRAESSGT